MIIEKLIYIVIPACLPAWGVVLSGDPNEYIIKALKMTFNSSKHHRRSIRLHGYDYASEGWYFITMCVQGHQRLLGKIEQNNMILNQVGKIIDYHWRKLPIHFKNIELDQYQIMPNHLHGIIHIVGAKHSNAADSKKCLNSDMNASPLHIPCGTHRGSLGAIIQNFKSVTSRKIKKIFKMDGVPVWQRNYYEHIIRDENDLNRIRTYICENPMKWSQNRYYL